MSEIVQSNGRVYWVTWGVLLTLTVIMLWVDAADIPRRLLLLVLLTAMMAKAALIAGNFMHLRHEHRGIALTVVVGLFVLGVILFGLIAPDAFRVGGMQTNR